MTLPKKEIKKQIARERERLDLERLQLSWLTFAVTLSAFGFTIYRVLESKLHEGRPAILGVITGREIGIFMIVIGIAGLVLASVQHIRNASRLKLLFGEMPPSVALFMSLIILVFTSFLLLVVLFRL